MTGPLTWRPVPVRMRNDDPASGCAKSEIRLRVPFHARRTFRDRSSLPKASDLTGPLRRGLHAARGKDDEGSDAGDGVESDQLEDIGGESDLDAPRGEPLGRRRRAG
jgi:hypothetical protein